MKTYENQSGTNVAAIPIANDAVRINRFRRVNGTDMTMRIPETATDEKRNVVIPPKTELGIATSAAANLAKTPIIMRKKQQQ